MPTFDVNDAKTNLACLLSKVEAGEEVVIARDGKPVARLVPYGNQQGTRQFGAMKDRVVVDDRFFDSLPEVELAAWEG
ncbi:MAG: type II toxin-antitoxin system prevent-host-death family antitoxin [Gemmatimonadota bacterium]|nr:type II toxin-antitoxin system prevent-host-death family antitoxin [Gemmatimonadota bacterium]